MEENLRKLYFRERQLRLELASVRKEILEEKSEWMRQNNVWGVRDEMLRRLCGAL